MRPERKVKLYTSKQREWIESNMEGMEDKYVTPLMISQYTDIFNSEFGTDRTETAIAAQFRAAKTKLKLPVRIAYTGVSDRSPVKVIPAQRVLPPKITDRIPVMMRELDAAFKDLVRQNDELRGELRKLAEVRAAIDRYRNGGK